jgi:uncharacterized membrane protein
MARFFLYLMAVFYIAAGINHFVHPDPYVKMMPPYIPYPDALVFISGVCEGVLGVLLLPAVTRPYAAWGIIALLIAVFPANIQMAVDAYHTGHPPLWLALARLPLQLPLVWWAWKYSGSRRPQSGKDSTP